MKSKVLLSRDFFVLAFGLVFAVVTVGAVYKHYIWPRARDIQIASQVEAAQNPDQPVVANRSAVMILKDMEQMFCLMLGTWAAIIIIYKFTRLRAEKSAMYYPFLNISAGERILPEEALAPGKPAAQPSVKSPDGARIIGQLYFDPHGVLISDRSTTYDSAQEALGAQDPAVPAA